MPRRVRPRPAAEIPDPRTRRIRRTTSQSRKLPRKRVRPRRKPPPRKPTRKNRIGSARAEPHKKCVPATQYLLQLLLKVIRNQREEMHSRILARDAVRFVRVNHQPELLP